MKKMLLCYPADEADLKLIAQAATNHQIVVGPQDSVSPAIFDAEIFCGHIRTGVDWDSIVAGGRLKWIQSSAAGLDHCLVPSILQSDIAVSGASGLFADQVAEQTMALVYGLLRGLPTFFRDQTARIFKRIPLDDLRTKSVAVLGCGGNGQRIANLLAGQCKRLTATDLFPESVDHAGRFRVFPADQIDQVLAQSDLVVCTLPLDSTTSGILNERRLKLIRTGGYLINVGRGKLVEEDSLVKLLLDGKLKGAGLDVFDTEPLPAASLLWDMPNVILTPHVGAQSVTRNRDTTLLFCENLRRYAAGKTLINLVDKQLGMPRPENRLKNDWRQSNWANASPD